MTILEKIIASKIEEVKILKKLYSYNEVEKRFFFNRKTKSLKRRLELSNHGIIAEHKRKSPSKSIINSDVKLDEVILGYDMANVCGISVLTDEKYFGGSINDLVKARELTEIPIIRKEFIIDEFQILEAKASGADVVLLIAACLNDKQIKNLSEFAKGLNLEVLVEIHNNQELEKCLLSSVDIIGVNNRNLKTFKVDLDNSVRLRNTFKQKNIFIAESGIKSREDIDYLKLHNIKVFLIGESLMRGSF